MPLIFLGLGVFLIVQVVMPLVAYKYWEFTAYNENQALLSPNPGAGDVLGVSVKNIDNFPAFVSNSERRSSLPYEDFTLSIPSINLGATRVEVESNSFEQSLAQMPGTALPGEKGNVFITGHSSLPQFYRPGNFKAIFSHLPEVKKGDEVIIEAGGQRFVYTIKGMKVVDPSETWVINPPDNNGRYLSLMTCVPPGLYLKRLIVLAELN